MGVAEAEHALGLAYQIGTYVMQDKAVASYWYSLAVEHENANAANNLALLYIKGEGVSRDVDKAEKLFLLAYKRGAECSAGNLVDLYLEIMDPTRALQWHERALQNKSLFDLNRDEEIREKIKECHELIEKINYSNLNTKEKESLDFICSKFKTINYSSNNPSSMGKKYDFKMLNEHAARG